MALGTFTLRIKKWPDGLSVPDFEDIGLLNDVLDVWHHPETQWPHLVFPNGHKVPQHAEMTPRDVRLLCQAVRHAIGVVRAGRAKESADGA